MLVSYKWLQSYFTEKLPLPEKVAELFTFHAFEVESMEKIAPSGGDADADTDTDTIFDIKVLADRAHYALSHRGIAYELAAILGMPKTARKTVPDDIYQASYSVQRNEKNSSLAINVEDNRFCPRYIGRMMAGIQVTDSPSWLRERLEAIGQRSINSIVDATNFVMFDSGQPLHAFDASKIVGDIAIRPARLNEKITTLGTVVRDVSGKEIVLPPGTLVIADDVGPLAIAGIKGGARAQVTRETKDIVIEAANFEPTSVRRTSTLVGIRNDSSKRFENGLAPELARTGMDLVTTLISRLQPGIVVGPLVDIYPLPAEPRTIEFTASDISKELGIPMGTADKGDKGLDQERIIELLSRLDIRVRTTAGNAGRNANGKDSSLIAEIPPDRLDLTIAADLAEEVGRLYGYEKIPAATLPKLVVTVGTDGNSAVNKRFYWEQKIRAIMMSLGFSEVYTHTLTDRGLVEIQNPLASDKCALRTDLSSGLEKALSLNVYNAPLLGLSVSGAGASSGASDVNVFEIGKVFSNTSNTSNAGDSVGGEHLSFAAGIAATKKPKKGEPTVNEKIRQLRERLLEELANATGEAVGVKSAADSAKLDIVTLCTIDDTGGLIMLNDANGVSRQIGVINNLDGIMEFNLDAVIDVLPEPDPSAVHELEASIPASQTKYQKVSPYPFVLRDIAVFVPTEVKSGEVESLIVSEAASGAEAASLLVRRTLFDIFTKKFPDGSEKTSYAFSLVFQSPSRTLSDDEVSASMKKISDAMTARGWQVR